MLMFFTRHMVLIQLRKSYFSISCYFGEADIETYDVDTQLNKITVTGKVTTEEVIKALQKIGKQSTIWDQAAASYNLQ